MITITKKVDGMTCSHCVSAVTRELEAVSGINKVSVELNEAPEPSNITVFTNGSVDESAIDAAIDEAGYTVAQ